MSQYSVELQEAAPAHIHPIHPYPRANNLFSLAYYLLLQIAKRGKGSHERWRHPLLRKTLTIPGKDGDDVPLYLEKQLAQLVTLLHSPTGECRLPKYFHIWKLRSWYSIFPTTAVYSQERDLPDSSIKKKDIYLYSAKILQPSRSNQKGHTFSENRLSSIVKVQMLRRLLSFRRIFLLSQTTTKNKSDKSMLKIRKSQLSIPHGIRSPVGLSSNIIGDTIVIDRIHLTLTASGSV